VLSALREHSRARLKTTFTAAVAAAAVLALAMPAAADPVQGKYGGHLAGSESTAKLKTPSGKDVTFHTSLFKLETGGKTLLAYCIEANTELDPHAGYGEAGWKDTTLGDRAKYVNWILHHSVPFLSLDQLGADAGLGHAPSLQDAAAGTQAAIWSYSDGYKLRLGENPADVEAVYKYLTSDKNTGLENEPAPTLSLSPESVSGEPGKLLGPIEVTTSAKQVDVSLGNAPEGAKLLGPDKKTEVTKAANGDKLWVSVPKGTADGAATVKADVVAKVSPGRVFTGDRKTQTLILAGSEEVAVHDEVAVNWTHTPTAAPGSESEQVCKPNAGLKVTLTNTGDAPAEFTVKYGDTTEKETVNGGEAKWKVLPVKEDTAYDVTVTSGDYSKEYKGVLNCLADTPKPSPSGTGGGLPTTGFGNLTTILGTGAGLLAAGLVLLFVVRKRRQTAA